MKILRELVLCTVFSVLLFSIVFANNVGLVVKDSNSLSFIHERKVKTTLEDMGFDVTLIDENSGIVDYSQFSLIVVAGRPGNVYIYEHFSDEFGETIPVNDYPSVVIGTHLLNNWGWVKPGAMSTASSTQIQRIRITDNNNPITSDYDIDDILIERWDYIMKRNVYDLSIKSRLYLKIRA